uniref:glucose-6-phosphatase n=1 Tax=Stegastes partitus TaxID=144197 RepID=A0A3B4ZMY9_9TELE
CVRIRRKSKKGEVFNSKNSIDTVKHGENVTLWGSFQPRQKKHETFSVCLAGSPSGHAMGAAGVWYVMVTALVSFVRLLQMILWTLMILVMLGVCMSRVYMAAHFPHQVVAGVVTGRSTLRALGVDLLWTLEKAQKWCVRPEWVHLDSTPFASLLRNMGSLLGLGLGLHSPLYTHKKNTSSAFRMGCILVSLFLLQLLDGRTFSSENHVTFYALSFGKSAAALLIPTTVVPWALSALPGRKVGGRQGHTSQLRQ